MIAYQKQTSKKELCKDLGIEMENYNTWVKKREIPKKHKRKVEEFMLGKEAIISNIAETRKLLLKFMEDYELMAKDTAKLIGIYPAAVRNLINNNKATVKIERKIILFLENHDLEKPPTVIDVARRLNKISNDKKLTHKRLSIGLDVSISMVENLLMERKASVQFKNDVDNWLKEWGY